MTQQVATYPMTGGLDTSSAALMIKPSALIYALNYEPLAEGYGRCEGYERYDGTEAPSAALFTTLPFDGGLLAIQTGDTITGATSGATAVVVVDPVDVTGTWGANAAGTLVLAAVTGTFQNGETLTVGGTPHADVAGAQEEDVAPDEDTYTEWREAALLWRRTQIDPVPGAGAVRGVAVHDGEVYAWRDNVGQTAVIGYRATASGWQALTNARELPFTSGGITEIAEGDVITGASSGATGTVVRVVTTAGSWAAGTASGLLYVTGITGAFGSENVNVGASLNLATVTAGTAVSFAAGGRYRTISHNFYGAANRYRLYGASGVDNAFEVAGGAMIPVYTGMPDDRPQRIFEIANHLGLTFSGGSVQFSGTGEPLNWTVILGAGEFGLGTEVTDVIQANETAVAIFGAQKIAILQGHDAGDFVLDTLTEEAGAEADTAQRIARTVYLDRRGLRSLDATSAFGNFKTGALSARFERHFKTKRAAGATPIGSVVSRSKGQYRLFWSDGSGLAVYMGGKEPQAMEFDLGIVPTCFGQGELDDGEAIFFGTADGYVYRLDSGQNFDGSAIEAVCMTPFNHFGSTMQEKRLHKVTLELEGPSRSQINISVQFDYADPDVPIDYGGEFQVRGGGGLWNAAAWNEFTWSDPVKGTAECYVDGQGRNASFLFGSTGSLIDTPHVLQAYAVHYSPRKVKR